MKIPDFKTKLAGDFMDSVDKITRSNKGSKPSSQLHQIDQMRDLIYELYLKGYKEGLEINLKKSESNDNS